jgi:DNA-binding MltR family transcriptional regulator
MVILDLNNLPKEIEDFYEILNRGTDLACVLVGTNFLDVSLHDMLSLSLKKGKTVNQILNHNKGFLGSFRSRSDLCYCMDLIDEEIYQDLIKISEIRNKIAHSHILRVFQNKDISEKCDDLNHWKILNFDYNRKLFASNSNQAIRNKFKLSVVIVSQKLLLKIREIEKENKLS